jgi:hypothetical protein
VVLAQLLIWVGGGHAHRVSRTGQSRHGLCPHCSAFLSFCLVEAHCDQSEMGTIPNREFLFSA